MNKEIIMAKVTLEHLKLGYKKSRKQITMVSEDLNVSFPSGKINVIIGESGCGKTSILRAIAGIFSPLDGHIYFDDLDVTRYDPASRNISYVSQMIGLYTNMSIFNNIAFPLKVSHTPSDEIRERVAEVADMMHISHCLARKPRELSIGQAQRVAISRAIIKRSIVYLMDEPFSNLDKTLSQELITELKQIFTRLSATVIFVSHDINEAFAMADRIYVMHEGKIILEGEPRKILDSKDERVIKLIKA